MGPLQQNFPPIWFSTFFWNRELRVSEFQVIKWKQFSYKECGVSIKQTPELLKELVVYCKPWKCFEDQVNVYSSSRKQQLER